MRVCCLHSLRDIASLVSSLDMQAGYADIVSCERALSWMKKL